MKKLIWIELISSCNLRCKMCMFTNTFTGEKLAPEIITQISQSHHWRMKRKMNWWF